MSAARLIPAYILHQRPYRNTSMLVEAFTAEVGRIGLVARGVRRRGSRTRALLEPFQPVLLDWRGRGELKTLSAVEDAGARRVPVGRALFAGYYCNELILRLLERESAEPLAFAAYENAIAGLARERSGGDAFEAALRRFELELLDALGYAPVLTLTADSGEAVDPEREYDVVPETGPVSAAGDAAAPGSVRIPGAHLQALARHEFDDPAVLRSGRRLLRAAIDLQLGGRPLKTRDVYRSLYGPGS